MIIGVIISAFLILGLDAFVYPGFVANNLGINPEPILIASLIAIFIGARKKPSPRLSKLLKLNKIAFPVLTILYFVFIYLENKHFTNYVFSRFHVDPYAFGYLALLSGAVLLAFFKGLGSKKPFYYLILPITMFGFWILLHTFPETYRLLVIEDGLLEFLQFFLYIISAFTAFKIFLHFKKIPKKKVYAICFLFLSAGLVFVAFEEISWGQRLLGIETPETIAEINAQEELTIHNLHIFQHDILHLAYMSVGIYGSFSYFIAKKPFPDNFDKIKIFTPGPEYFFCFFSVFVYYFLTDIYLVPNEIKIGIFHPNRLQEVFETYLAFGFFGYITETYKNR
jgi:hypothetical protein